MENPSNASDFLVGGNSTDIALVDGGMAISYQELRVAATRLAAELCALKLPAGSRVGLLGPNSLFWIAGYLAAMKLNLVVVPFSDKATVEDVRRNSDIAGCAAVFLDRRCQRRFAAAFDGITAITEAALATNLEPIWPDLPTDPNDDAALMFTSGTTNVPKAVRITHGNIAANTESIIAYLGLERTDRALVILPFYYCYGASLLHTHLRVGARVVLCNSFVFPETTIDLMAEQGCTVFAGVPSSFQLLLRASTFAERPLPALRIIQQAGGKLPPVQIEELLAAKPDAGLFIMYGQTEATARLSYLPPGMVTEKMGSIGRGIPGVLLRVLGEDMRPVAAGERGEIYATGANVSPGYFNDPVGSASKFTADGLRTGDLATVDSDGYIYVVDRRDDFIKSWGYRVSSQEVEACVLRLADLVSAAAIAVPDDAAGEAVALYVTARPGSDTTADQVLAFCRANLPKYMVPRSVQLLDAMPLNANGKVAKVSLRTMTMTQSSSASS